MWVICKKKATGFQTCFSDKILDICVYYKNFSFILDGCVSELIVHGVFQIKFLLPVHFTQKYTHYNFVHGPVALSVNKYCVQCLSYYICCILNIFNRNLGLHKMDSTTHSSHNCFKYFLINPQHVSSNRNHQHETFQKPTCVFCHMLHNFEPNHKRKKCVRAFLIEQGNYVHIP